MLSETECVDLLKSNNLDTLRIYIKENDDVNYFITHFNFDQLLEKSFNDILNDQSTKDMISKLINFKDF